MTDDDEILEPDDDDEILDDERPVVVDQRQIDIDLRVYKREVEHEGDRVFRANLASATWEAPPYVSSLKEELDLDDEPPEFTFSDLQVQGTNALLLAQFKVGKTTTAASGLRSLADGTPFLGQFHPRKLEGRIAYWNYEMRRDQFREWMRRQDIAHPERVVPLNLRDYRMPLSSPHVQEWTIEWLRSHEIEYWILDPWRRVIVGSAKENDNDEITALTETIDVIKRKAGVSDTLTLVHTPRATMDEGEERARGASALDDWADVRWILTKTSDGRRYFRADGRDVGVKQFAIGVTDSGGLDAVGGSRRDEEEHADAIVVTRTVWQHPGQGYDDLEKLLPFDKNRRPGAIVTARERLKWVRREKEGRKTCYYITELGQKAIQEG
jgi:hypothetical protein